MVLPSVIFMILDTSSPELSSLVFHPLAFSSLAFSSPALSLGVGQVGPGYHKFSGLVGLEFLSLGSKSGLLLGSKNALFKVKNAIFFLCSRKNCPYPCFFQLFQKNYTIIITCMSVTHF